LGVSRPFLQLINYIVLLFNDRMVEAKEKDITKADHMTEDLQIPEIQKAVL